MNLSLCSVKIGAKSRALQNAPKLIPNPVATCTACLLKTCAHWLTHSLHLASHMALGSRNKSSDWWWTVVNELQTIDGRWHKWYQGIRHSGIIADHWWSERRVEHEQTKTTNNIHSRNNFSYGLTCLSLEWPKCIYMLSHFYISTGHVHVTSLRGLHCQWVSKHCPSLNSAEP